MIYVINIYAIKCIVYRKKLPKKLKTLKIYSKYTKNIWKCIYTIKNVYYKIKPYESTPVVGPRPRKTCSSLEL